MTRAKVTLKFEQTVHSAFPVATKENEVTNCKIELVNLNRSGRPQAKARTRGSERETGRARTSEIIPVSERQYIY